MLESSWYDHELSKGQETKLKIMKVAIDLFARRGISSVTLKQIAEASGTSHPLIIKHFDDKEGLFFEVRKYVSFLNHKWVDSKITPSMDGRSCLLNHCFENLNWAFHNPAPAKMVLLTYYYSSLTSEKSQGGLAARSMGVQRVLNYVLQAEREGFLTSDQKVEVVAEMIHEYALGLYTTLLTRPQPKSQKIPIIYKKKLNLFLDLFLS